METPAFGPIEQLLLKPLTLAVPLSRAPVITLKESDTVDTALSCLGKHRILSAPVVSDNGPPGSWVGIIGYHNFLKSFGRDVDKKAFLKSTLKRVAEFSNEPNLGVNDQTTLLDCSSMLRARGTVHRLIVTGHNVTHIISQSDIVRYVHEHINDPALEPIRNITIAASGLGQRKPTTLSSSDTVYHALTTMIQEKVKCLAIIDPSSGTLVGNFSESDMRGLGTNFLEKLTTPVGRFLAEFSPASLITVSVRLNDTIAVLLTTLAVNRLHHVWIQDADGHPAGIVTLTDILDLLFKIKPE